MKVFVLLGFHDYEGSEFLGVFESLESVQKCVEDGKGGWWFDQMGYVHCDVGQLRVERFGESDVEWVKFHRGDK